MALCYTREENKQLKRLMIHFDFSQLSEFRSRFQALNSNVHHSVVEIIRRFEQYKSNTNVIDFCLFFQCKINVHKVVLHQL